MAAVQQAGPVNKPEPSTLAERYARVRSTTAAVCAPLSAEDCVVQSMPDASPAKWHLAHTSWFFEHFVLQAFAPQYRLFDEAFEFLFNSYYQSVGPMHERPQRGMLTRPGVNEVRNYREHVDAAMTALLIERAGDARLTELVTLGLNHEQQHQELLLTDVKHLFSCNPLLPAYRKRAAGVAASLQQQRFIPFDGGVEEIGANGDHFVFDNETPRHRTFIAPYALSDRLITNAEYLEFVSDGGYRRHEFWLSDGWSTVMREQWARPFYWAESLDAQFTLGGLAPLEAAEPVSHLSYYEADAFARWAGARLPTEAEWEHAASTLAVSGNFLESGELQPRSAGESPGLKQMFGDVWEWTASPYAAYPGYRPLAGALGEYNGKFMCNQLVLRGGSCVTSAEHIRATYRNFFYPQARWQFTGARLARDL